MPRIEASNPSDFPATRMIFERIPSFLSAFLFLWRCDIRLSPAMEMKPANPSESSPWVPAESDPTFTVHIWRPISGWLITRVKLAHDVAGDPSPPLHLDSGNGRNAFETLRLVPAGENEFQAIAFLRSPVRRVRLAPGRREDGFCVEKIRLYNIPWLFVRPLVLKVLATDHADFRGSSLLAIRNTLRKRSRAGGGSFDQILEQQLRSLIELDDRVDYETWIREFEIPHNLEQTLRYENKRTHPACKPLISVLLPVFRPRENALRECLDSVLAQTYPAWELCIAGNAASMPNLRHTLEAYEHQDERVRVAYGNSGDGISAASNAALAMARGAYAALLDHDDTIAPNALLGVVDALQRKPRPKVLYSDEDEIDAEGRRISPHFKGDWNPDLLYSRNYISRLCIFETALLRSLGGFRQEVEKSQEYDLLLRASARIDAREIHHIPLVLYHRRTGEASAASLAKIENDAWEAGARALQAFFETQGNGVRIDRGPAPFSFRPRWPLPDPAPLVSIIIPTRDNVASLKSCISSVLAKTRYSNFEIMVIDNDSRDKSALDYLAATGDHEQFRVLKYPGAFNYSAINNFAAAEAGGAFLCLLNDDIEVIQPDWLEEMVSHACRPEIGCVGAKLAYPDGRIQHGGVICGIGGVAGHAHRYSTQDEGGYFSRLLLIQNLSAVTAACLVVRRDIWRAAGGMNATALPIAFNDVDFCLRVRQMGYRNLWTPYALLTHHESASRRASVNETNKRLMLKEINYMKTTWGEYLNRDPYYSPHLTLKHEDFSIAVRDSVT